MENDLRKFLKNMHKEGMLTDLRLIDEVEEANKVNEKKMKNKISIKKPSELVKILDKDVIGQDEAKRALSIAVYNHYKRVLMEEEFDRQNEEYREVEIEKSNIIVLGDTGSGKTYMLKCIAKAIGVPIFISSATSLTSSGYVGDDVESILSGLLRICDFNIEKAEHGIVVIDEIDKIRKSSPGVSITKDVGGECVQQGLLKIVEGAVVGVPPQGGRKHPEQPLLYINTKNILFIGLGSFVGLEGIINERIKSSGKIGFKIEEKKGVTDDDNVFSKVEQEDLMDFGMIPEFVGRFPVLVNTNKLSVDELKRVLTEPRGALVKQYRKLMKMDGVDLSFDDDAVEAIAEVAIEKNVGARGLRGVMEKVLSEIMFNKNNSRKKSITITRDFIVEKFSGILKD